ncbi:MAG: hypothetical protein A3F16_02335 [Deltaproteobacteria bacterium RIFCSPHIGHO2_12_FULL_43_9]|nr:MAG: hypothetical protein A3F16_02335 [Deltaproteobacteria bacterium RIFCSPHIGHO2_12_FULL_43_9]
MSDYTDLRLEDIKTIPLNERPTKVKIGDVSGEYKVGGSFREFIDILPRQFGGADFHKAVDSVVHSIQNNRPVIWGIGAHVIKNGLSPLIIQLIKRDCISAILLNGAGLIHDFELGFVGATSEDVGSRLSDGDFGMGKETAQILNHAIINGDKDGLGIGESVKRGFGNIDLKFKEQSLIWNAAKSDIPLFVVAAIGTDTIHFHPSVEPGALGRGLHRDALQFSRVVANLEGGVFLNIGSAVLMPELFLKAVTLSRNLGYKLNNFTTINLDFMRQYRPETNVVDRPTRNGGVGISLIGQHELLLPMFIASILEKRSKG